MNKKHFWIPFAAFKSATERYSHLQVSKPALKMTFFLPCGHKKKLGQGRRQLDFVRPNHRGLGHLVKKKRKMKSVSLGHSVSFTFRLFNSEDNDNNFQRTISQLAEQTSKCISTEGGNQPAWLVQLIIMCWRDIIFKVFLRF